MLYQVLFNIRLFKRRCFFHGVLGGSHSKALNASLGMKLCDVSECWQYNDGFSIENVSVSSCDFPHVH